jgi:uncharacterized protein (DUF2235 family)
MGKKLIVCCDGTWSSPDQIVPTNVVKLKNTLLETDSNGIKQEICYDRGIGTNGGLIGKYIGGATGLGISKNIRRCYHFIAENFEIGDEIYCFGFSRGAYTVRSLVGLVASYGLLDKQDLEQFNYNFDLMYDHYRTEPQKRQQHKHFEKVEALKARTVKSRIKFIGVWDTVGALGAPTPMLGWVSRKLWVGFHDTELRNTDFAYQALAIDERRKHYRPSVWTGTHDGCQEMKQVWFAGAHRNVGGGYQHTGLSDTALLWMIKMAQQQGLEFDRTYLDNPQNLNPDHRGQIVDSYSLPYRVFGPYLRPIGQMHEDIDEDRPGINEMLHESVVKRSADGLPTYNPENLARGLQILPVESS